MSKEKKTYRFWLLLLFLGYLFCICYFLFVAESWGRFGSGEFRYNLIPFKEIRRYITYRKTIGDLQVFLNLFGNVIAFMPMGYLLPKVWRRPISSFSVVLLSMEFSVLVEVMQLILRVGACDIDDVILNTFGAIIGCCIHCLANRTRGK